MLLVMATTIIEVVCGVCQRPAGDIRVEDEDGEDCNAFEQLKDYKLHQATSEVPHKCACGGKLTAHMAS